MSRRQHDRADWSDLAAQLQEIPQPTRREPWCERLDAEALAHRTQADEDFDDEDLQE